ncbi:hypothetical protein NP233_g4532 [Leucocoprinus birnbaumii]|uniref:Uncharacterized protein n=1 Tax=Leucocoprinus birnbaumii TaxID=56174 RepID=A0AAD5YRS8_9AGAR|nr:hypothetical protein NP233_g4532 [Leucocoprinus birnbaumii]
MSQSKPKTNTLLHTHGHTSKPSVDTTASGLAESAISFSAFPEPPSSIPPTPIRSVFGSASPSVINSPVSLRYDTLVAGGSVPSTSNRYSRSTVDRDTNHAPPSPSGKPETDVTSVSGSNISPYDWHEGASSIDVDATEDRLLPTSFITSLLRENVGPRAANRASFSSDAFSGISEMTYPPRNPFLDSLRESSAGPSHTTSPRQSQRGPLPRPIGARPRNSFQRGNVTEAGSSDVHPRSAALASRENPRLGGRDVARKGSLLSQSTVVAELSDGSGRSAKKLAAYNEIEETEYDSQPDIQTNASSGLATSVTPLTRQRSNSYLNADPLHRESFHSIKSTAPSFMSRISSLRRRALTWRRKPLPPIPTIPRIAVTRNSSEDEQAPLPELVSRANQLHGLLEKGYHPHQSMISHHTKNEHIASGFDHVTIPDTISRHNSTRNSSGKLRAVAWVKNNKPWVTLGIFILIAIIAIAAAVGVTAQRNKLHKASDCQGNLGGADCNLNATCVCTSSSSPSSCSSPIGQAVLDVIPVMNTVLATNITTSTVYSSLWIAQGGVQGSSCVEQVDMIDVGPQLDPVNQPNRTQWAQSALLWTLTQTQNLSSVEQLQDFVRKAAWSSLPTPDGPTSASSGFNMTVAGFNYDFASQTITPISAKFVNEGQPSGDQASRVDASLIPPLDHIYSYAVASSKQRENALLQYWTNTLHQREDSLGSFKAAFNSSPIVLPFDATSHPIQSLYNATSFPPPTACYPGLRSDQQDLINAIEGDVFGLPQANTALQFDTSCFPVHPAYGILDVLRLRFPYPDFGTNVTREGVVLKPGVAPRAVLAMGAGLSALPGPVNSTRSLTAAADPRNYGTPTYANHIILQYLSSMDINTANAVVSYILSAATSSTPAPADNLPLNSIPSLEVAVFGSVEASDADIYLSPFTLNSGSLFFGSSDGSAFRNFVIGRGGQIAWAENATSAEVVYDKSFSDLIFNQTWAATAAGISTNAPDVGLSNITGTFSLYQRFSP